MHDDRQGLLRGAVRDVAGWCVVKWQPGTVAEIGWTMTNGRERAMFDGFNWRTESGIAVGAPTDVRPLVVLDPDALGLADLPAYLRSCRGWIRDIDAVADAIEAQTRPPKPPEPTGLGAVVRDREGEMWVRVDRVPREEWAPHKRGRPAGRYADIDAVEVLSEGVTP